MWKVFRKSLGEQACVSLVKSEQISNPLRIRLQPFLAVGGIHGFVQRLVRRVEIGGHGGGVVEVCKTGRGFALLMYCSGIKHVLLGSVAEKILRHAPCPVLSVRADERDFL